MSGVVRQAEDAAVFDVANGLWLEDRRQRLAWGTTSDELRTHTAPDFVGEQEIKGRKSVVIVWNDSVWGGFDCQARVEFGGGHWPQDALRWVHLVPWPTPGMQSLRDELIWSQCELSGRFGPPATVHDDGEKGRAEWRFDGVSIRDQYFDGFCGYHKVLLFVSRDRPNKTLQVTGALSRG
ncbi:MAG: hypothetical protein C0478_17945 [Planctomyces sp.]|nr:hypothetical protein [Planctomyces sp.]